MSNNTPEPLFVTTRTGKITRILTPAEYDTISQSMSKMKLKTIFEVLFYTGLRYVELERLYDNPNWVQAGRNTIHLPFEAQKKGKRTQLSRSIPIAPQIKNILPYFFNNTKPSTYGAWYDYLQRRAWQSGIDGTGINIKTTRKTIESWMLIAGVPMNDVCLRQGHDDLTSLRHYQGLAFTPSEKQDIKNRLSGW